MSDEPAEKSPEPSTETAHEMPREAPTPQRRRILLKLFLGFCAFTLIAFGLLSWYVTTESFQRIVRRRVIAAAEQLTGGRVELGELHTIPLRLRVEVRNLTIHGHEAADQAPFLHVDRVQAEMKIISLLSTTVGLHSVVLEHPVVHLIDYPDGSTNAPVPPARLESNQQPVEQLLSLSVSHIEVQRGELLWENKNVPFAFDARDLALVLHYSLLRRQYEAQVRAGAVDTHFQNYASFVWRADASLVLARNRVDIKSLTIASGKSEFHFAGHLQDFHNPQLSGDYRGTADLGELASLGRQAQLRKGAAQFEGKVSWSLKTFSTDGSMQATDLEWSNGKISMRNGRIAAGFSLTPDRLRISSIRANLLGGDLRGDAEVINWQRSIPSFSRDPQEPALPPARRRRVATSAQALPQRGSIHLQLAGFPLFPAMQLLSSRKLPLDQLNLGGSTSGTVEMSWKGSIDDAESHVKLGVVPPAKTGPGEIPVLGQIDAVYRGSRGELEVSELHLTTPGSEITAAGTLSAKSSLLSMASSTASSSSSSLLRFSFTSHNLKEWTPLLEAAYARNDRTSGSRAHGLPFLIHGWAKLAGTASGPLSALSVNGNLEVYDFDVTLPATQQAASREVHWDALTAAVQFSTSHFAARNTSVIHGQTTAHFEVSADLEAGSFAENSAFTLHVDAHKADLAELLQWAGVTRPAPGTLTGTLDVAATLSGTRANPHGDGHIVLHQGVAYGVTIPLLTGDLRLANGELQFNNIDASAFDAPLSGDAAIGITGNDFSKSEFRLNVTGRNLDLARFPRLRNGHLRADGVSDFAVRMSGTPQQPSLEAHVHLKDLALDNERFGDFYVDAVTQGQQLQLTAHSGFERGDLNIAGSVSLDHDFPADLKLSFHQLDIDSLLREYLPVTLNGHSQLEGTLRLYGPLRTPRDLKATAELQSFAVKIDNVEVKSEGPIRLEVSDQMLRIEELHLAGSGTDFTAHGRAHLAGAQELDLRLDGSINMALFQSLNPKILARGTLGLKLDAGGTLSRPVLQGQLEVKNTFISHNDFPSGLSDLNGVLHFDRNRIQIESLSGTTGGGNVALTGSATYQDGAFALDFGATAQGVRLRYPPGVSSTANADLRLTGTSNNPSLSGDIVVTKLAVTPGFDFGAYIEKSRQATVISQSDSLESRLKLDVHVVTTPELQMQTAIARLSGNADLRVRGTAERPAILGRVEVLEGEINFNGNKYNLERGDVTFANPAKTQPVIDLQASTRVRDYDITVQFRGDASVPNGLKVTWQSEPQLPQADVIALLALGRTQEESAVAAASGSSFGFGGDASNLLINQALNSTVNSRLQRLFGASRVKVDPQGLASETSVVRGPQVTVEQQVASNVTLTYSTNVSVSNQQIIQLEYNITRTISIVALRDQNGVVSFDFKLRRRRK